MAGGNLQPATVLSLCIPVPDRGPVYHQRYHLAQRYLTPNQDGMALLGPPLRRDIRPCPHHGGSSCGCTWMFRQVVGALGSAAAATPAQEPARCLTKQSPAKLPWRGCRSLAAVLPQTLQTRRRHVRQAQQAHTHCSASWRASSRHPQMRPSSPQLHRAQARQTECPSSREKHSRRLQAEQAQCLHVRELGRMVQHDPPQPKMSAPQFMASPEEQVPRRSSRPRCS